MGKKQKKKATQSNGGSVRDDWLSGRTKYSDSESPHNEDEQAKELWGYDSLSSGDPYPYYTKDNECVKNLMKAEVKLLTDKVRYQQDLFDKRECSYKENITKLKS